MSNCPQCNTELKEDESICPNCGCLSSDIKFEPRNKRHKKKKKPTGIIIILIISIIVGIFNYFNQAMQYQNNVQQVGIIIENSGAAVDNCSNLLLDVWKDAIWGNKNENTKKYVFPNGKAVNDFNVALNNLYSDAEFADKINLINESQRELRKLRKELENPSKDLANYNSILLNYIDEYIDLSMILVNPSGSYNDISAEINGIYHRMNELSEELQAYSE